MEEERGGGKGEGVGGEGGWRMRKKKEAGWGNILLFTLSECIFRVNH